MAALNKKENEETKAFITRRQDEGRCAYDRERTEYPRQFVLGATSNKKKPFKDIDGNRRWWILVCRKRMETATLEAERDQVWAEAAAREATGEPNWLSPEIEAEARRLQSEALRIGLLQEHLEDLLNDWENCFVRTQDLYRALGLHEINRRTNQHSDVIESAMKRLGFKEARPPYWEWCCGEAGEKLPAGRATLRARVRSGDIYVFETRKLERGGRLRPRVTR